MRTDILRLASWKHLKNLYPSQFSRAWTKIIKTIKLVIETSFSKTRTNGLCFFEKSENHPTLVQEVLNEYQNFLIPFTFSFHKVTCKIILSSPFFFCNYLKFRKNKIKWPGYYPTPKISKLYILSPYEDSRTFVLIFCCWSKKAIWVGQGWKLCYIFSFLVFSILAICFKFTLKIWKFTWNSKKIVPTMQIFSKKQSIGTWE